MDVILNEYSLQGQFSSMEEFISELGNVVGCIKLIRKNPINKIYKTKDFYNAQITSNEYIYDMKRVISAEDALKSFQLSLDAEVYDCPPYWDDDFKQSMEAKYFWENQDVSATGMAEAAVTSNQLLSFRMDGLVDAIVEIEEFLSASQKNIFEVDSIFSVKYLLKKYGVQLGIKRDEILKER